MKFISLIITAVLLGFGTNHAPMPLNFHGDMCHGVNCADLANAAANDVACALHCLAASLPAQTSAPSWPLVVDFLLTILTVTALVFAFKKKTYTTISKVLIITK